LPELTSEKFQIFGKAVKAARVLKGMTLDQAAYACLGRDNAKGYFSQIENGKRQITPRTAGKIITALGMNPTLLEPFLGDDEVAEDEVTKVDADAEKLLEKAKSDQAGSVTGERLLIDLAYDFAQGQHTDLFTAYKGLRAALQAARELKEQGYLPQNTSSQLDAVLRRVSTMNEEGDRDGAAEYLAVEEKRLEAESEALFNAQLKQDRVRNRPELAAKRLYKYAARKAHEAKEQRVPAIVKLIKEWREYGDKYGDMFSLQVALEIAKANNDAASGKYKGLVLFELGWSYFRLAERSTKRGLIQATENAFQLALQKIDKSKEPLQWAASQGALAMALTEMGLRNRDAAVLRRAVSASRASLETVRGFEGVSYEGAWHQLGIALQHFGAITSDPAPLREAVTCLNKSLSLTVKATNPHEWKSTHINLGLALRSLGGLLNDLEVLNHARDACRECDALDFREQDPMGWAKNQWNIADLALARFSLIPDQHLLSEAREYVIRARNFFVDGSEYQTKRCDELIERIMHIETKASVDHSQIDEQYRVAEI
jgi:transcriptional regulator with XRE-family HTH domain